MKPQVSLFASSVRPHLWEALFKSLKGTSVDVEVVFAGNVEKYKTPITTQSFITTLENGGEFKYIKTANIKPAQCYEVARRKCTGELICWIADDCEFPNDVIGKAYKYYIENNLAPMDIMSIQTKENYGRYILTNMSVHRFFGGKSNTPLMAPLGLMDRLFLDQVGGLDRRYICGQYENDIVMRLNELGGKVFPFGSKDLYVDINHEAKHGGMTNHFIRPFAAGYPTDRKVLESSWTDGKGDVLTKRNDKFEPFEDKDLLTKSQSNNLPRWE